MNRQDALACFPMARRSETCVTQIGLKSCRVQLQKWGCIFFSKQNEIKHCQRNQILFNKEFPLGALRFKLASEVIFYKFVQKDIFGFLRVFDETAEEVMRCISNS